MAQHLAATLVPLELDDLVLAHRAQATGAMMRLDCVGIERRSRGLADSMMNRSYGAIMLTLTDIQVEMNSRGGVEATGIRLTRDEFEDLVSSRGRPADALIQRERAGKLATVMGLPVTWVEKAVTPKLLPPLRRRKQ